MIASSFVSGDDVVIASFGLDSSIIGPAGTFQVAQLINTDLFTGLNAGDPLLLRWFNVDQNVATPGVARYGQFRTDSIVDASDSGWFFPAGSSVGLNFVTESFSGSNPESAGEAIESTAPIPEPATWAALLGACSLGVAAAQRRRRI